MNNGGEGMKIQAIGWGGRIRTLVWLDQNQLPYRLATPQNKHLLAPAAGIEPATCGLTVRCSTAELRRSKWAVYAQIQSACQCHRKANDEK